ncbi:MAG: hypothetical protein GF418_01790 [Chitinivibrionales bacterium]|nr:hypothetical protein [Chitinivibrionales bacterium]MBD3394331.1 hypothetical protein [Chitinivibrionales bacterium]
MTVLVTGETHGMVRACDCAGGPPGGLANRASVVAGIRGKRPVLLLDGGGFSGGGVYDSYTEGRHNDSVRTLAALEAMGLIGYDAVTLGDDDLQYGAGWLAAKAAEFGVPLVCANLVTGRDSTLVAAPYVVAQKGTVTFAITGVVTDDRLFAVDTLVAVREPVAAVRDIYGEMRKRADVRVAISHLGEEQTKKLASAFPDCAILVNAHRKESTRAVLERDGQLIMQFGFQGKKMSFADLVFTNGVLSAGKHGWLSVGGDTPVPIIAQAVSARLAALEEPAHLLDLYLMTECPHGMRAVRDLLPVSESFTTASLDVWFIGSLEDTAQSREERIWLAVEALYPELYNDFAAVRAGGTGLFETVRALALDSSMLVSWAGEHGNEMLAMHYSRSGRLGVTACPTLFINNQPAGIPPEGMRVARELCARAEGKPRMCDSLPECFEDRDCSTPGKIGVCARDGGGGTCVFREPVTFEFIALMPDSMLFFEQDRTIETTRELFPGARIRIVRMSSREGRRILQKLKPEALPLYLFDSKVKKAARFEVAKPGLVRQGRWYVFKEGVLRKRYFHRRKMKEGLAVFIDPLFADVKEVLRLALEAHGPRAAIYPALFADPASENLTNTEKTRQAEALRWLVLREQSGNGYRHYLEGYMRNDSSGERPYAPEANAPSADTGISSTTADSALVMQHWQLLQELEIQGPVEILIDNRELVPADSYGELRSLLEKKAFGPGSAAGAAGE